MILAAFVRAVDPSTPIFNDLVAERYAEATGAFTQRCVMGLPDPRFEPFVETDLSAYIKVIDEEFARLAGRYIDAYLDDLEDRMTP